MGAGDGRDETGIKRKGVRWLKRPQRKIMAELKIRGTVTADELWKLRRLEAVSEIRREVRLSGSFDCCSGGSGIIRDTLGIYKSEIR